MVKYWICKSAPALIYEAMECLGGNGYVEEGILARLYREAPVNAIWEGSGNVVCLDVLRALSHDGEAARAVLGAACAARHTICPDAPMQTSSCSRLCRAAMKAHARAAVERLALLTAAAALRASSPMVAAAFARHRLAAPLARLYGAAELTGAETALLLDRALPSD